MNNQEPGELQSNRVSKESNTTVTNARVTFLQTAIVGCLLGVRYRECEVVFLWRMLTV